MTENEKMDFTDDLGLMFLNSSEDYFTIRAMAIEEFNGPVVYDESERLFNAADAVKSYIEERLLMMVEDYEEYTPKYRGRNIGLNSGILRQIIQRYIENVDFEELAKDFMRV